MLEKLMFKKVELWLVTLFALAVALATILFGYTVWYNMRGGERFPDFSAAMVGIAKAPHVPIKTLNALLRESELRTADHYPEISGFAFSAKPGATTRLGYLLLNRHDGDRKISVSELVDLDRQKTIHTWDYDVDKIWDGLEIKSQLVHPKLDAHTSRFQGIHALLSADGSVVTQGMGTPLFKLDVCGKLMWAQADEMFHHAIQADSAGNIWVPAYLEPKQVSLGRDSDFHDDAIVKVSPTGEILFRKSVIELMDQNNLGALFYSAGQIGNNDPVHLNDIEPVLTSGPYWQEGDLLLSLRNKSMLVLYRPSTNKVLWHRAGPWLNQHDVDVLDDHRISVFDNNMRLQGVSNLEVAGYSRVLAYDFKTDTVTALLAPSVENLGMQATLQGLADTTESGDMMIENSLMGRLVQLDPNGRISWQYINRAKNGAVYVVNWSRLVTRELGDRVAAAVEKAKCDAK